MLSLMTTFKATFDCALNLNNGENPKPQLTARLQSKCDGKEKCAIKGCSKFWKTSTPKCEDEYDMIYGHVKY